MSSAKEIMFKKRSGTSEISGHLNKTKLISLVLFRLLHDDRFEYFYLASNIDEVDSFDDLCFKAKIKGIDRPVIVFMQVKHKDNDNSFVDFDQAKNFYDSYSKVVQKFNSNSKDKIFNGKFEDNECIFVLYTNGRYNCDSGVDFESPYARILNELLATGKKGTQLDFTKKIVEESAEAIIKEEIATLAEHVVEYLNVKAKDSMQIMTDDYILRYHVILEKEVFDVSEIQSDEHKTDLKWRVLRFRESFFESNEKYILLLKKSIYKHILQYQVDEKRNAKLTEDSKLEEQMRTFFDNPCASTLSPLIGAYIENKDGKLVFISQRPQDEIQKLEQINLAQIIIEEAEAIAAKIILNDELKVPVTFGNTDLIISERRMDHLIKNIVSLCNKFELMNSYKIVKLDETVEDGLSGAIGNLLVYDEDTKLLKFTDHCSFHQKNAHIILNKLKSDIADLHDYRFDVKDALSFPKLTFDCNAVAKEILQKIVVYARQSDHNGIEAILKTQIQDYHNSIASLTHIQPASMFLNYHGEVQNWWLLKHKGSYLTKDTKIYQRAISNIAIEPQINSLKYTFNITKMKDIEYTTKSLESLERLSKENCEKEKLSLAAISIIVTDITTLTTIKVLQYLKSKSIGKYAILDLETMVNQSTDDFCALKEELKKTDRLIIIICDNLISGKSWYEKYLKEIAQVVDKKETIVVTNDVYVTMIQNAFSLSVKIKEDINQDIGDEIIIYEKHKLTDLSPELQKSITKNGKILFQGHLTNLDSFLDDTSVAFVEGKVLEKMITNKSGVIQIGDSLSNPDYEEISHLYQERVVEYVTSHLIPGNVYISNVDCNLDGSYKYPDYEIDQEGIIFSINLLEDRYNDTNPDISKFKFVCRLSPNQISECTNVINIIVQIKSNDEPTVTNCLSIKKTDIAYKIWTVEITLLGHSRRIREWQRNEKTSKDILNTLKYMCRGALMSHIIGNENIEIRSVVGDINKETMNNLFKDKERNYFWSEGNPVDFTKSKGTQKFFVTDEGCNYSWIENNPTATLSEGLPKDYGNNIASCSSDRQTRQSFSSKQEDLDNESITVEEQKASGSNNTTKDVQKDFKNTNSSIDNDNKVTGDDNLKDELPASGNNVANIMLQENVQTVIDHSICLNVRQDYVNYVNSVYAGNYFSLIPDIAVIMNDAQEGFDRDKNTSEHLDTEYVSPGSKVILHNFNLRFHCKRRILLRSFDDIKDDVVLLTAKPGVGKSTLLTHLSHKIKNKLWIVRVNLINFCGQFNKWQKDKSTAIDILKILNLMFKVILSNKKVTVQLKETCSKVYLEYCSSDDWDRFHLNMFLHYFNQGKLLLLFDGFDEICPDYKDEVIKFLEVVKNDPRRNKMWITSRPYNSILPDLEKHFGRTYKIDYFNKTDQKQFLKNFWHHDPSIPLNQYNSQKLLYNLSILIPVLDDKLKMVGYNFYDSIVTKYELREPLEKIPEMKLCFEKIEEAYRVLDKLVLSNVKSGVYEFLGTPLLLHLSASFFETEVLNIAKINKDGWLVYNIIAMYEWCIENKLKDIFFQNKCGIDIDMPLAKETYDEELEKSINLHKKLGAHAIFGSPLFKNKGFYFEEFKDLAPFNIDDVNGRKELDAIIERIRQGKEITGLISYVTDDGTAVFIHKTFAEYFAYDYVCDILKSDTVEYNTKKLILTVILTIMHTEMVWGEHGNILSTRGISTWVQERGRIDEELERIGTEILNKHPLIEKFVALNSKEKNTILKHVHIRLMNSTSDDYENATFMEENIEDYLKRRRAIDSELFKMMKPHYKKKIPQFSDDMQYCSLNKGYLEKFKLGKNLW